MNSSDDAPPAWAQRLMDSVAELQAQFRALQLGTVAPAPLPTVVSAEATAALLAHPYLSDDDQMYARLLDIAFPLVTLDEDCYDELVGRIAQH